MPSTGTVRRWQNRIALPTILAGIWLVLYTSGRVHDSAYVSPESGVVGFLFSPEHLSQPLGWLFLLSLLLTVVGLLFGCYVKVAGH